MNQIYYIFMLFSLLFLIETKAINILISFVGLIITLAFMLPIITYANNQTGWSIESEYYSYILILVQVSALTILFGFIIMLFPTLSHSTPIIQTLPSTVGEKVNKPLLESISVNRYTSKKLIRILTLSTVVGLLFFFFNTYIYNLLHTHWTEVSEGKFYKKGLEYIYYYIVNPNINVNTLTSFNPIQDFTNFSSFLVEHKDTLFLRKLGFLLYSIDHNIIKLLILTIILLLAIISLFFLIIV